MKSGGCFVIWICLAMITIPFYVFRAQSYIFHGKLGCSSVFNEANGLIDNGYNQTRWILRRPEYYVNISRSCLEADKCSHVIKNSVEHSGLTLNPLCPFFIYYQSGKFSTCANSMIDRLGQNISCIDRLFGIGLENFQELCNQWLDLETCLLRTIEDSCQEVRNLTETRNNWNILKLHFCDGSGNKTLSEELKESETSGEILEEQEAEVIV